MTFPSDRWYQHIIKKNLILQYVKAYMVTPTLAVCWHYLSKAGLYHGFHEGLQQVKYWLSDLNIYQLESFSRYLLAVFLFVCF